MVIESRRPAPCPTRPSGTWSRRYGGADSDWINAHYELVDLRLPGDQYQLVDVGESGALDGVALLFLGAGLVVVNRRSPG